MNSLSKEQAVKLIKNGQWMVQGFNGLPLYLHTVASNTGWLIKPIVGVNYSRFFLRSHESRAKYSYDEKDLLAIGNGYYKNVKTINQLNKFRIEHKNNYFAARKAVGKIPHDLSKLDLKSLIDLLQKITKELALAIGVTHCIEGISFVSEQMLKDILISRGLNDHENFQLLCAPVKASFLSQAQTALWKIKNTKNNGPLIKKFLRDFGWIDNSYVKAKVLTAADVLKKARHQKPGASADGLKKTIADKQKLITSLKLKPQELFVVKTIEICTTWQDDRKKYLMKTINWLEPIVEELAARVNLPVDVFKYMYSQEVTYKNLTDKKFLNEIKSRYPQSDYYVVKNKIFVFSGKDVKYIEKQLEEITSKKITELKGMVACKGVVTGRVRICRSIHDIPKVKKGEILVASMTRPEFLPAMQKAAGFITDEGGITSHAAIISREMNKPCIIGTKHATEVLQDGDLVTIDAYQGLVKKIA